jgi:hypothetical protein
MDFYASNEYQKAFDNVVKYTGLNKQRLHTHSLFMTLFNTLTKVIDVESQHKSRLEKLAIDIVLGLPQMHALKEQVDEGHVIIDAKLKTDNISIDGNIDTEKEPEIVDIDQQLEAVFSNIDNEKIKRKFANMMTQGAAISNFEVFHLAEKELNNIDPNLINRYGIITSCSEMGYWIMPEMAEQTGPPSAGKEHMEYDKNGKVIIHAVALCFPLLVHEIIKGALEVVSYGGLPNDKGIKQNVLNKVDSVEGERLDILIGPQLWKRFISIIDIKDQNLTMYIYQKLLKLSTQEDPGNIAVTDFAKAIKTILLGGQNAKDKIHQMIDEIKAEIQEFENENNQYKQNQ